MSIFTNNRLMAIITGLLITANIVTLALLWMHKDKQPIPLPTPPHSGPVFEFVNKELGLTKEQQDAYAKLREEHQKNTREAGDSLRKMKDSFFELLKQPGINEATVKQSSDNIMAMQQRVDMITFKHFQQLRALCTETQQKKFDSIIVEVIHRMAPKKQGPPPSSREGGSRGERMPPPADGEGPPPPDRH